MTLTTCDKHEMQNCAECNGDVARQDESMRELTHWEKQRGVRVVNEANGPTIRAQYNGTCARTGRRYEIGSMIQYSVDDDGWIWLESA